MSVFQEPENVTVVPLEVEYCAGNGRLSMYFRVSTDSREMARRAEGAPVSIPGLRSRRQEPHRGRATRTPVTSPLGVVELSGIWHAQRKIVGAMFDSRGAEMAAADSNDISSLPQADQDAIGTTLISLLTGFRERDADKLVGIYTSDADWVNAFGSVKKGGDEIVEYLRGLFSDDNFNAGTVKAPPETAIRVLTPDVVLVSAHLQVEGQKLVGGGEIEVRDNHSLRVLHRQGDGSWLIVSEMYNDANREQTYEGHS
jgi:uncharacterized protein (TIGR02246 family)